MDKKWFYFIWILMGIIIALNILLAIHCGHYTIGNAPGYCLLLAG